MNSEKYQQNNNTIHVHIFAKCCVSIAHAF